MSTGSSLDHRRTYLNAKFHEKFVFDGFREFWKHYENERFKRARMGEEAAAQVATWVVIIWAGISVTPDNDLWSTMWVPPRLGEPLSEIVLWIFHHHSVFKTLWNHQKRTPREIWHWYRSCGGLWDFLSSYESSPRSGSSFQGFCVIPNTREDTANSIIRLFHIGLWTDHQIVHRKDLAMEIDLIAV